MSEREQNQGENESIQGRESIHGRSSAAAADRQRHCRRGVAGGSLLTSLIPMLHAATGGMDLGALAGQLVGGGVSGAIVSAIVGMVMNNMKSA